MVREEKHLVEVPGKAVLCTHSTQVGQLYVRLKSSIQRCPVLSF